MLKQQMMIMQKSKLRMSVSDSIMSAGTGTAQSPHVIMTYNDNNNNKNNVLY